MPDYEGFLHSAEANIKKVQGFSPHTQTRNALAAGCAAAFGLAISSCVSIQPAIPPTNTLRPPTETPRFDFPTAVPSPTFTPEPSPTLAPEIIGNLGRRIFSDDFYSDLGWDIGQSDVGGASFVDGRLSLAVRQPDAFYSISSPVPKTTDFYLEFGVRAEVCSIGDEYGLMFRSNTLGEHYRLTLTCESETRVSRILESWEKALVPTAKTHALFPGMMVTNHIGIFAEGNSLRFIINDIEVFTAQDSALTSGGLSFFVRTRRAGQATISFEYLHVYGLLPTPEPSPTGGTPTNS
jgi:hypothetical protein